MKKAELRLLGMGFVTKSGGNCANSSATSPRLVMVQNVFCPYIGIEICRNSTIRLLLILVRYARINQGRLL